MYIFCDMLCCNSAATLLMHRFLEYTSCIFKLSICFWKHMHGQKSMFEQPQRETVKGFPVLFLGMPQKQKKNTRPIGKRTTIDRRTL